jgi:zinc protease
MNRPRPLVPFCLAIAAIAAIAIATAAAAATADAQKSRPAKPAASAKSAAKPPARLADLEFPPLPDFAIPQPQRTVLANGMVVMLLEDHELPLIDATALVRTGSRLDPADKVGLGGVAAEALRTGGTERMSPDQLDDYLEGKAASIETSLAPDVARVTLSSLREDFPDVLRAFADVLRRPAFAEDRLAVVKLQERAGVARQNDNPQGILMREFSKAVYGADSPYARTPTFASLDAIGRADVVAWHRAYFHPERVVLGVVGDFRPEEVLRQIEQAFGDWPRGDGAAPAEVPVGDGPKPGVYYAEKNDINQSNIAFGDLGIRLDAPDYYAVEVMNQVFSGGFASRLNNNVRTKKGLAYAVDGRVGSDYDRRGFTYVFMTTKTATTGAGIEALLEEVRAMTASPPDAEEVDGAKRALLNSFVFRADTRREVLDQQLRLEYFGYPLDWLSRYRRGIEAVTAGEVRQAAADHLKPERFAIVVVGPKEGTDRPLSAFGPVTTLDITIPGAPAPQAPSR